LFLHAEANTSGWAEVHEALAEHFSVWAPVHPGFGGDPLPLWLHDVSDLAFHYVDAISALGLDRPLVVGVSLGGWMGLDLAVHRSDLLAGLVLVGALGLRPTAPMPDLFIKSAPEALGYLARTIDTGDVDPLTGDVELVTALWVEQATQARLMWERPYDRRLERRAHHVKCPTTVVWGADDRLLPVEHGRRLAGLVGAAFVAVPEAGHLVTIDAPAAVVAAARATLSRAPGFGSDR
jgi:pimeloyl-ACP methyl ester carboxylesterase